MAHSSSGRARPRLWDDLQACGDSMASSRACICSRSVIDAPSFSQRYRGVILVTIIYTKYLPKFLFF